MNSLISSFSFNSSGSPQKWLLLIFLTGILGACTQKGSSNNTVQLAPDYAAITVDDDTAKQVTEQVPDEDCAEHIKKITCVSDSDDSIYDNSCSTSRVKPEQHKALLKLANEMPPFHKKVFCNLNRIQIQDSLFSAAYAGLIRHDRKLIGTFIGVRGSIIMGKEATSGDFDTWKEQLNYGLSTQKDPTLKVSPLGPTAKESAKDHHPFFAYFVHELNHLIDQMNSANNFSDECVEVPGKKDWLRCKVPEQSFHHLSWGPEEVIYNGEDYENNSDWPIPWAEKYPALKELCYYVCKNPVSLDLIPAIYKELNESDFLTPYSTQSFMEDFAEASTVWAMYKNNIPYLLEVKDSKGKILFSSAEHTQSLSVQQKLKWIDDFFSRKDLKYHPLY